MQGADCHHRATYRLPAVKALFASFSEVALDGDTGGGIHVIQEATDNTGGHR